MQRRMQWYTGTSENRRKARDKKEGESEKQVSRTMARRPEQKANLGNADPDLVVPSPQWAARLTRLRLSGLHLPTRGPPRHTIASHAHCKIRLLGVSSHELLTTSSLVRWIHGSRHARVTGRCASRISHALHALRLRRLRVLHWSELLRHLWNGLTLLVARRLVVLLLLRMMTNR